MTFPLRRAEVTDAEALAVVGAATFLETYAGRLPGAAVVAHCLRHHTAAAWREVLAAPGAVAWLVEADGGAPVGYGLLTEPDLPGSGAGDVELRRIYLLSGWQRAGLGGALLRVAADAARARGAARLLLGVWQGNTAALGFYARAGFGEVGTRRFTVGDLVCDDFVLGLALDGKPQGAR